MECCIRGSVLPFLNFEFGFLIGGEIPGYQARPLGAAGLQGSGSFLNFEFRFLIEDRKAALHETGRGVRGG